MRLRLVLVLLSSFALYRPRTRRGAVRRDDSRAGPRLPRPTRGRDRHRARRSGGAAQHRRGSRCDGGQRRASDRLARGATVLGRASPRRRRAAGGLRRAVDRRRRHARWSSTPTTTASRWCPNSGSATPGRSSSGRHGSRTGGERRAMDELEPPLDPEWRLYGRSASDDKVSIVALLAAVDALDAAGIAPTINIKLDPRRRGGAGIAAHRGDPRAPTATCSRPICGSSATDPCTRRGCPRWSTASAA